MKDRYENFDYRVKPGGVSVELTQPGDLLKILNFIDARCFISAARYTRTYTTVREEGRHDYSSYDDDDL